MKQKINQTKWQTNLVSGDELASVLPGVGRAGVSQVLAEVLKGALAGDNSLDEETEHGEHGESAIFDLLHLKLGESIGVVSKAQGVEGTTGVLPVKTLSPVKASRGVTESLSLSHEDDLNGDGGNDRLGMDQVGVAEVVEAIVREDGGTSLEPGGGITELGGTVCLEELGGDAAKGTKHGPASVDHLDLAVAGEGLGVSGETGGIPAVVTGVLTVQVAGGNTLREGAKELGAVSSVPE